MSHFDTIDKKLDEGALDDTGYQSFVDASFDEARGNFEDGVSILGQEDFVPQCTSERKDNDSQHQVCSSHIKYNF